MAASIKALAWLANKVFGLERGIMRKQSVTFTARYLPLPLTGQQVRTRAAAAAAAKPKVTHRRTMDFIFSVFSTQTRDLWLSKM